MSNPKEQFPIDRLNQTYGFVDGGGYGLYILRDTDSGVTLSDHLCQYSSLSAIVAVSDLRQRLRRRLPGDWLVTRDPKVRTKYAHEIQRLDPRESEPKYRRRYVKPSKSLRQTLDEAEALPIEEQLRDCGFEENAAAHHRQVVVLNHRENSDLSCAHFPREKSFVLTHTYPMIRWDPSRSKTRRHTEDSQGEPENIPIGLEGHSAEFDGTIDDLAYTHILNQADEEGGRRGHRWRFPSPHFHTHSGGVVCMAIDAIIADNHNDPTPPDVDTAGW